MKLLHSCGRQTAEIHRLAMVATGFCARASFVAYYRKRPLTITLERFKVALAEPFRSNYPSSPSICFSTQNSRRLPLWHAP